MDLKKFLPHLIATGLLFGVSVFFFAPNFFGGKVLYQSDNDQARGMQTEIQDYLKKEGKAPLWTNAAFGGMPGYQIYAPTYGNLIKPLTKAAFLWTDVTGVWAQVLAAMFFMYLLVVTLGADWRVAIFGALAYGISTYHMDLLGTGHSTKMAALAFAPGILAATVLLFNGRLFAGTSLLALMTSMQIYVNHVQITYYTFIIVGIFVLFQFIEAIRHKAMVRWTKALLAIMFALLVGTASNLSKLWPTYEYSRETIRGKSELKSNAEKGDGLDKEYLFGWSYGIGESLTLLVPHFAGGGNGENFGDTKLTKAMLRQSPPNTSKAQIQQQAASLYYSGEQPGVGTAIYFGAIVCFLFFLGAFLVPGPIKWWLTAGGLFMITLAWGKYFFLNHLLFDYLPLFNKFRAVSMALGPAQLCVAALAAMGLQKLADQDISLEQKKRALWFAIGASTLLCLVALVAANSTGPNDKALDGNPQLLELLKADRADMLRSDVMRTLGFVLAAAAMVFFYLRGTFKAAWMVGLVATLSLADTWMVCTRTISSSEYQSKQVATRTPPEEAFDQQIKADRDPHYRVLDLSRGSITGNAITSYFHKSLSGYHAAKLQRYNEVVMKYFGQDLGKSLHIVGMLNGKYIINDQGRVFTNPEVCGNAWFVGHCQIVPDADTEFQALGTLNPKDTVVVQASLSDAFQNMRLQRDSGDYIRLTKYHPDRMTYEYSAKTDQIAVFSEIWYPPSLGWKCYLNGQPAPDFIKADYLLRAMKLPAGEKQQLEMRFEPKSYYLGEKVSYATSAIILLLCLGSLFWWYRGGGLIPDAHKLGEIEDKTTSQPLSRAKTGTKKK